MNLQQYANKIYTDMIGASSILNVEVIFNRAVQNLITQEFSDIKIEEFKEKLRNHTHMIMDSQENEQTLKNQQKAIELLKKG